MAVKYIHLFSALQPGAEVGQHHAGGRGLDTAAGGARRGADEHQYEDEEDRGMGEDI